ncbi:hypothetical protein VCHA53O466_40405 [Vibrio chagasii]|nr:hypothetical protein VCHA53O466_40405 [Vibrio chagasii]
MLQFKHKHKNMIEHKHILEAVKLALINEVSHMNIRLIIWLLSNEANLDLRSNLPSSSKKLSQKDCADFTSLDCGSKLYVKKVGKCMYSLQYAGISFPFKAKDSYRNKKQDDLIIEIGEAWMEIIGSDRLIYSKPPSLTRNKTSNFCKSGKLNAIQKALHNNAITSKDEAIAAFTGCRTSLFHVGYDKYGIRQTKKYCDPQTILLNRQRVEDFIERSVTGVDFSIQLEELKGVTDMLSQEQTITGNTDSLNQPLGDTNAKENEPRGETDFSLDDLLSNKYTNNQESSDFSLDDLIK